MGVYQTKEFARFARKERLAARTLLKAAQDVGDGRFDADLGGGVFKQRVARRGGGKSGGYRTILALKRGGHCFFLHGYAKSEKANVSARELEALRDAASVYFAFSAAMLKDVLSSGALIEVVEEDDEEEQERSQEDQA